MTSDLSRVPAGYGQEGGEDQDPAVRRMRALIAEWEEAADERAVFLSCYLMMTRNMLEAIKRDEFHDAAWVDMLLHRFADYYFEALEAYEQDEREAPAVWQMAHNAARQGNLLAVQGLLLGVNAHINYDLVLTLLDLLEPEWESLTEEQRAMRYSDHCRVNDVIGSTMDAVQDQVLEPAMPAMDLFDRLLGPLDEKLVSHLISDWRDQVWRKATHLLQTSDMEERLQYLRQVEDEALKLGRLIG